VLVEINKMEWNSVTTPSHRADPFVPATSLGEQETATSGEGTLTVRRRSLRSQFYRAARDLGNVEAAAKGPVPYGRRMARRKVYRSTNRVTADLLKRLGL
jgi:hypothetical protein